MSCENILKSALAIYAPHDLKSLLEGLLLFFKDYPNLNFFILPKIVFVPLQRFITRVALEIPAYMALQSVSMLC